MARSPVAATVEADPSRARAELSWRPNTGTRVNGVRAGLAKSAWEAERCWWAVARSVTAASARKPPPLSWPLSWARASSAAFTPRYPSIAPRTSSTAAIPSQTTTAKPTRAKTRRRARRRPGARSRLSSWRLDGSEDTVQVTASIPSECRHEHRLTLTNCPPRGKRALGRGRGGAHP